MDEQVRTELTDILKTGGRNLCFTPRTVVNMLRERCPDADEPITEIEEAVTCGCVKTLLDAVGPIDEAELTAELESKSGLSSDRARWAIASWVQALAAADSPLSINRDWSAWNQLDVSQELGGGSRPNRPSMVHLIIVGLAGAAGGASLGVEFLAGSDINAMGPWHEAVQDLPPWLQGGALVTFGILGGFAGGVLGWIASGGVWAYDLLGGTAIGRLIICAIGAGLGALIGVLTGVMLLGLIGVMLGALIGALAGAVLGILSIAGVARYWW